MHVPGLLVGTGGGSEQTFTALLGGHANCRVVFGMWSTGNTEVRVTGWIHEGGHGAIGCEGAMGCEGATGCERGHGM